MMYLQISTCFKRCVLQEDKDLKRELNKFWQLESLGIIDYIASESDVYCDFSRKIKFNGIRYQVSLPFKEQHTLIPDMVCVETGCIHYCED